MKKLTMITASAAVALLCAGAAQADVAPGAPQEAYGLFEQLDQDGDGIVTEQEFAQADIQEEDRTALFSTIDTNGDGIISQSEWGAYEAGAGTSRYEVEQPMGAQEQEMGATGQDMPDVGEAPTEQPEAGMDETLVPRGDYEDGSPENVQREHLEQKLEPEAERANPADVWDEQTYDVNDPVKIEPEREATQ